ncbi:hypothetical protein [Parafrankia soli]|uniref:hypothetical protein n=1 Tax=Parafrankia soli TaxID=2599596 RepID=UPI001F52ABCB|nr:hypothetical protein [Parafrankia soli]
MDANRRQAFELVAAGLVAAQTYREWTTSGPDVLTLEELEDAVNAHAAVFTSVPHHQLVPAVWATWQSAHDLLRSGGGRARSQAKLTAVAGYSSYMLGRLAFNLGDPVTSRRFIRLAGDHAEQINDAVLTASVGEMISTLAFYGLRYQEAATAAQQTAELADNEYTRARIAGYEARALGALGDTDGARAALERMHSSVSDLPVQPGCSPFSAATADMFAAGVLARIGAGTEAEPLARRAVAEYDSGRAVGFEDHGGALLALAWSLTNRPRPVIDEGAALASRAVELLDARPTAATAARIVEVSAGFAGHAEVEPVRDFWDRWEARPRLAIATGDQV